MNSLKVNSPVTIKLHIYNTDSRYCVGVSMNVQCRWSQVCNKRGDNTAGRGCFVEKQEGYTRPTSRDETRQRSTPRENVKKRTPLSLLSVFIVHLPWCDVLQSDGSDVRPREPMELARGIFPFLADGKTRRGGWVEKGRKRSQSRRENVSWEISTNESSNGCSWPHVGAELQTTTQRSFDQSRSSEVLISTLIGPPSPPHSSRSAR